MGKTADEIIRWLRTAPPHGGVATHFILEADRPQGALGVAVGVALGGRARVLPLFAEPSEFHELIVMGPAPLGSAEAFTLADHLRAALGLASCEPDLPVNGHAGPPRDGFESSGCWVSEDDPPPIGWALEALGIPTADALPLPEGGARGGAGILIGHVDTGVNTHHELDGALEVVPGANFVEGGAAWPIDPLRPGFGENPGHGISTGSVIISRVAHEITGSAPAATLMPIRAIESVVRLNQAGVARAVDFAHRRGCQIITMSLGGVWSRALHKAIRKAVLDNVLVLAAAGNCVRTVVFPARYRVCLAVAGVNAEDAPWVGSCRGKAVDVSAPAELVWRAHRARPQHDEARVRPGQGTSYAVALTAGVAARWLAHFGREKLIASLNTGEVLQSRFRRSLRSTARQPKGWDPDDFGAGIVDAGALLQADPFVAPEAAEVFGDPRDALRDLLEEAAGGPVDLSDAELDRFGPELGCHAMRRCCGEAAAPVSAPLGGLLRDRPSLWRAVHGGAPASVPAPDIEGPLQSVSNPARVEDADPVEVAEIIPGKMGTVPAPVQQAPTEGFETLIGGDDRVRIEHTSQDPWRRICALRITAGDGSILVGTGWLVGPRTLVTAGHCVHDRAHGGWARRIEVSPGRDGHRRPFGRQTATRFFTNTVWRDRASPDYDVGAIQLDTPIGDELGWFGVGALTADDLRGATVHVAGYPVDKGGGTELMHHADQVVHVDRRRLYYVVDTVAGQSGSPVWIERPDEQPIVVGVHAYGVGAARHRRGPSNSAPRILPEVIRLISAWKDA